MSPSLRVLLIAMPVLGWGCAVPGTPRDPAPCAVRAPAGAPVAMPAPATESGLAGDIEAYLASNVDMPVLSAAPLSAAEGQGGSLPPVKVVGERFHDEDPVGPYKQPGWTTRRRFATTRAYVLPEGQIELEAWWRGTWPEDSQPKERIQGELGVGLPYRLQLDMYINFEDPAGAEAEWDGAQVELRWALADWDEIFWNPTLYGEWKFVAQGPDVYELKLLMSDDLGPRWRGAVNAIYEAQDSGAEETEIAISGAVSYTIRDEKFYAGVELKVNRVTEGGPDGAPDMEILLGPSFQWRPTPRTHLDIVPLFGLTDDSPVAQVFVVFGIGFSGGDEHGFAPTSLKSQ
ncbi:MAG TPA: hypothetical protein VFY93_01255 [Planctomycetota bacterium]|nr:hypothetical protein [Planctomycetota bacterium]